MKHVAEAAKKADDAAELIRGILIRLSEELSEFSDAERWGCGNGVVVSFAITRFPLLGSGRAAFQPGGPEALLHCETFLAAKASRSNISISPESERRFLSASRWH